MNHTAKATRHTLTDIVVNGGPVQLPHLKDYAIRVCGLKKTQDYPPLLLNPSETAPFSWQVPDDYVEHLNVENCGFDYWNCERALRTNKQLFEIVVKPTSFTCRFFYCYIVDRFLEQRIDKRVSPHHHHTAT